MKFTSSVALLGAASLAAAQNSTTSASTLACEKSYDACRTAANANMAYCASQYAACLGYNPFASNGTNTVTSSSNGTSATATGAVAAGGALYTTEVLTSFTTYCPAATTLVYAGKNGNQTITVASATTLTITDCPCTFTRTVSSSMATKTPAKNGTATTYSPSVYTGAANKAGFAGAAGVFALAAFAL
ncbi:hypothetical protein MBLNU459_g5759t1 [Dothideomycetes sp. NU459]